MIIGSDTLHIRKGKNKLNYDKAKVYLEELSKYGSVLGLEAIGGLLEELGNPQDALKVVHIAGTNGKGSVLAYTSTILQTAGYRVGQYTSPCLRSKRELIQVDGAWIRPRDFAKLVETIKNAIARLKAQGKMVPTVFEVETAMAFLYFQKKQCDIVVLETGMGGRDDATNIVKNTLVSVFTSIGLDHMDFLGETIEEIAEVKAGIMKPGSLVVSTRQDLRVVPVLEKAGKEMACPITFVDPLDIGIVEESYEAQRFLYKEKSYQIHMAGRHQLENACTALEVIGALRKQGFRIRDEAVKAGLKKTMFFGRFTLLRKSPVFIIDGAHNEDGVKVLAENIKNYFPNQKMVFIVGVFQDKKYREMAGDVLPLASDIYTVTLPNLERSLSAEALRDVLEEVQTEQNSQVRLLASTSIKAAVRGALETAGTTGVVIAFGSLSYLAAVADEVK